MIVGLRNGPQAGLIRDLGKLHFRRVLKSLDVRVVHPVDVDRSFIYLEVVVRINFWGAAQEIIWTTANDFKQTKV